MPITPLPTPIPSRQQPEATFVTNADNFLGALPTFVTEANALETNVNAKESTASAAATTATTKAGEALASANAAALSETAAAGSASSAAILVQNYQGALASDPTVNKTGGPLVAGDWYANTTTNTMRAYTGTGWVQAVSAVAGVSSINGETGEVVLKVGGPKLFYFSNL